MIKSKFTYTSLQVILFAAASLYSIDKVTAETIDSFSFCTNTCKTPHCEEPKIKARCEKVCKNDNLWMHVASLELSMSKDGKDFRKLKGAENKAKKEAMLYDTEIAKCLDIKAPEPTKEPVKEAPNKEHGQETGKATMTKDELCAAALTHEMRDLRHDQADLHVQEQNMVAALEGLRKGTPKD